MIKSVVIEQEMQQQFHQLAEETHRTESEIIHSALAAYLAADHHYMEVLNKGLPLPIEVNLPPRKRWMNSLPSAINNEVVLA